MLSSNAMKGLMVFHTLSGLNTTNTVTSDNEFMCIGPKSESLSSTDTLYKHKGEMVSRDIDDKTLQHTQCIYQGNNNAIKYTEVKLAERGLSPVENHLTRVSTNKFAVFYPHTNTDPRHVGNMLMDPEILLYISYHVSKSLSLITIIWEPIIPYGFPKRVPITVSYDGKEIIIKTDCINSKQLNCIRKMFYSLPYYKRNLTMALITSTNWYYITVPMYKCLLRLCSLSLNPHFQFQRVSSSKMQMEL